MNLRAKAEEWMAANPETYGLFTRFALEASQKRQRFGAKALAERVRWECFVVYGGEYKVNNNYTAYIARQLIVDHPELSGLMRFRETKY